MQHRGSSDSRATADSHCEAQGSRNEMEMSREHSRDVLLIWLVKLQERVQRVDTFVRGSNKAPAAEKNTGWPKNAQKHVFLGLTKNTEKQFYHLR